MYYIIYLSNVSSLLFVDSSMFDQQKSIEYDVPRNMFAPINIQSVRNNRFGRRSTLRGGY